MWQIPLNNQEKEIAEVIGREADELGISAYLVGGFVRDKLLQRPCQDIDIVTEGDGIALAKACSKVLRGSSSLSIFKTFGTAHFKYQNWDIEFVGTRKESYAEHSRNPTVTAGSMMDDQKRRDFTINAMAISLTGKEKGNLIDPFNGLSDLENQCLRTPLNPDITFADDPLRMMRAVRFASQLGFFIEQTSLKGIEKNSERLKIVSQERITDELNKIILSPKPSVGFELLYQTNLLHQFFPEMIALAGVEMVAGKGHKDNFYHTLQVLDNTAERSSSLWLRWAAILHDIGKPKTKRFEPGVGWTFHGHDAVGERMCKKIFTRLKLPLGEPLRYVSKLVALHLRPISLSKADITDSAMRRLLFDAGDYIEDLMMLCESDITSKNKHKVKRYLENFEMVRERLAFVEEKDKMRNWQPPVSGEDIMARYSLAPSRTVGYLKNAMRDAILDGEIPNEQQAAYELLDKKAAQMGILKP